MKLQEFAQEVQEKVAFLMGEEYQVSLNSVKKNNGVYFTGLMIKDYRFNLCPTIYLESFYESFKEGKSLEKICEKIKEIYYRDTLHDNLDFSFYKDYEKVKSRICYKLISVDRNRELLKDIPHIVYMDMVICFYYSLENTRMGNGSVLVQNTHMDMWKVNTEILFRAAQENTPRLFPASLCSMEGILQSLIQDSGEDASEVLKEINDYDHLPMQVLSNTGSGFGATCMIYPGLLQTIAEKQEKDFYILPSSIYEVILLTDDGKQSPLHLSEMVREINATQVQAPEVLSDSIYHFSREDKIIRRIL